MYCSTSRICHEFLLSWGILELVVEVFWLNTRVRGNECICLKCKKDLWRICISIRIPSLPAGDSGRGVKCIDWTLVSGETTPRCDHQWEIRLLPFSKWPLSRRWITVKKDSPCYDTFSQTLMISWDFAHFDHQAVKHNKYAVNCDCPNSEGSQLCSQIVANYCASDCRRIGEDCAGSRTNCSCCFHISPNCKMYFSIYCKMYLS